MAFGMIRFRYTTHTYTINEEKVMWFDYSDNGGSEDIHKLLSGIGELNLRATENVKFQFEPVVEQSFGELVSLYLEKGDSYKVTLTAGENPGTVSTILVERI